MLEDRDVFHPTFYEKDTVKVRANKEVVSSLQYGHQLWSNEMEKVINTTAKF